jgi:hypothetical protein
MQWLTRDCTTNAFIGYINIAPHLLAKSPELIAAAFALHSSRFQALGADACKESSSHMRGAEHIKRL